MSSNRCPVLAWLAIVACFSFTVSHHLDAEEPTAVPEAKAIRRVPKFTAETVDDKVQIGYGVAIGDVDGDGKDDILLADKKQFVWYQNPMWKKHVLAENLTEQDNVCIAARDIDGDGKVEIAVGGEWNPSDTIHSGAVFYLTPPEDRTQRWKPIKLHHEPVVHRMRWVKLADKRFVLVVAPLHGKGNRNAEGAGVKLYAYHPPQKAGDAWQTTLIDDALHVTHNLDVADWDASTEAEELLYLGREGAVLLSFASDQWKKSSFPRVVGGGEIRAGQLTGGNAFITTIEPFHGDKLVVYPVEWNASKGAGKMTDVAGRQVLDDDFNQGHALATGDFLGLGNRQIVAGWRNPNRAGKVGLKFYWPTGSGDSEWHNAWIDENGMAAEDVQVADLNGDGLLDIIASGRSTNNLKVYWNQSAAASK